MHLAPVSLPPIVGSSNGSPKLPPVAGSDTSAAFSAAGAAPSLGASDSCAYAGAAASNSTQINTPARLPCLIAVGGYRTVDPTERRKHASQNGARRPRHDG